MSILQAAFLGILQGITEFLPISSDGHLSLAQKLLNFSEPPIMFDLWIHIATLLATALVFRRQLWNILKSFPRLPNFARSWFQKGHLAIGDDPEAWLLVLITVTTFVTGVIGIVLKKWVFEAYTSYLMIGLGFAGTAVYLWLAQRKKITKKPKTPTMTTIQDAALIGLAQGLAVLPGLSRSGSTISSSILLSFERTYAGEYSFLAAIPAITGAFFVTLLTEEKQSVALAPLITGFLVSFVTGYAALTFLLKWIRTGNLKVFVYYCAGAAALSFGLYFYN